MSQLLWNWVCTKAHGIEWRAWCLSRSVPDLLIPLARAKLMTGAKQVPRPITDRVIGLAHAKGLSQSGSEDIRMQGCWVAHPDSALLLERGRAPRPVESWAAVEMLRALKDSDCLFSYSHQTEAQTTHADIQDISYNRAVQVWEKRLLLKQDVHSHRSYTSTAWWLHYRCCFSGLGHRPR